MIWLFLSCASSEPERNPRDAEQRFTYYEDAGEGARVKEKQETVPSSPMAMEYLEEEVMAGGIGALLGAKGEQIGNGGLGTRGSRLIGESADNFDISVSGLNAETNGINIRSWFPETFIFEPLIETDENGHANYAFTVPDRLTTWRILGLAHTQTGLSAGNTHEIMGTLPQYIDPVIPAFMRLNDQIKLPIMSFNTTSDKIKGQIKAKVVGGSLSKSAMSISLPPYGTFKSDTILTAKESGLMDIQVSLRGVDTVNDHIKVYPLGQKITSIESGILNARHNFKWKPTQTAISSSSRLQLSIYPGAIGFFRSELRRSLGNDLSSNVYSIVMSERMKALALEMELEESFEALDRQIEQNAQQLFFNLSKSHENAQSVFLLEAFLSVKDNLVMHRMGMSMANRIADSQLPDGTFQSNSTLYETPTTVQEHLVTMAKSAMIFRRIAELEPELKPRANRVIQLINQGITRLWKQHQDGYTAAWLIVAELGTEMEQEQWKLAVKETLTDIDGLWNIAIPDGVKSPGGGYPSLSEYQALASVVLQSDAEISAYLLSQVMTSYNPQSGWGNNLRNEIVFHCITQNISQALPDQITLSIYENDQKVSSTVVKKESLQDLVFIDIPLDQDSRNQWHLMAAPPAPSMSFAASFIHYEPFSDSLKEGDIALEWKRPKSMSANQPTAIPITLSLPSQTPFNLRLSLPTGVKITPESKQSLETSYTIKQTDEELSISGISSDKTITHIKLSFIAQFKGRISGGGHVLETDLGQFTMAPQTWTIK